MNKPYFQTDAWYQAMTINERIASLKRISAQTLNLEFNAELAQRRMQGWKSQSPFTTDAYFSQRLDIDETNEDEFFYLLGEPIKNVQERFLETPNWLVNLAKAFSHPDAYKNKPLPPQETFQGKEINLFLYAIEPLIRQGSRRLREGIETLSQTGADLPFDSEKVVKVLFANLPEKLFMMLNRTIALEVQVARLQGQLKGDTSQQRFYNFFEQLRQPEPTLALLQEYPVLARQLTIAIEQWVTFSLEFLHHLCADWQAIQTTFSLGNDIGQLVAVEGGAGDTHQGGRSVAIAKFSSGLNVVYKPRSLATDIHFQQLLTWLNERGNHPPFRTLKILNRETYGWVEFVTAKGCSSKAEVRRFYERQGGYLALLYALEATDFHYENLIAAGEHPVLIDLESLFHPRVGNVNLSQSELLAWETLNHSVLRIGLLPQRIWSKDEYGGIDVSGLGAREGQLMPGRFLSWEGIGTDEIRLVREQLRMTATNHRPTLNGTAVDVLDYAEALSTGFTKIYQLFLKHRDELLSEQGPLACFAEDEVRVILRPTRLYALLLSESFHPDLLCDALKRDQFFDRLWFGIEHQPHIAKLIRAEREDLLHGDIPMFTTHPNSRDLLTSSGEQIADFFEESGMTLVQCCLQQLSDSDLAQQISLINASLATVATISEPAQWPSYRITKPQRKLSREKLLAAAQAIGDRLEELALKGKDDATWIGLRQTNRGFSLVSLGVDLYDGLPGIVLFLAYLGVITQEQRYTSLAQAALSTIQTQIERAKSSIKSIGGFGGWGGLIYTFTHLSRLWERPELLAEAEEFVKLLPPLIEQDKSLDVSGGAAGCIGSLLSLYHCAPSEATLAAAIQCGEHLIAQAQPMERGIGWITEIPASKPLTGLAHGAAGIAWALLELSSLTGEKRFLKVALEAINYERSLFLPKMGNWPDLRNLADTVLAGKDKDSDRHNCMTAWCYGASGIGLVRLRSLPHLDDAKVRSEINTALKTTLNQGFGSNHSLCHGDLGNLELLLQASLILDEPQWKNQVERVASIILESIERHGWLCGVPLGVETPGLMTGLAGIGYGLLRLAEPELVASVLLLEPPNLNSKVEKTSEFFLEKSAVKIA